eukprot:58104-Pleurochrysis_carterae.AAC.2
MAATDAKKVNKAMRTSVGWFSLPLCALIYQCSKYVALTSSKGYAIARSSSSDSTRSSQARRWSPSTTSCSAPSRTCWPSAALVTIHLLHRCSRHQALLAARQLAHLPQARGRSGR